MSTETEEWTLKCFMEWVEKPMEQECPDCNGRVMSVEALRAYQVRRLAIVAVVVVEFVNAQQLSLQNFQKI